MIINIQFTGYQVVESVLNYILEEHNETWCQNLEEPLIYPRHTVYGNTKTFK